MKKTVIFEDEEELDEIDMAFQRFQRRLSIDDNDESLDSINSDDESMFRSRRISALKSMPISRKEASIVSKKTAAAIDDHKDSKSKYNSVIYIYIIILMIGVIGLTITAVAIKDGWLTAIIGSSITYLTKNGYDTPCSDYKKVQNSVSNDCRINSFPSSYAIYANKSKFEDDNVPLIFDLPGTRSTFYRTALSECLGYRQIDNKQVSCTAVHFYQHRFLLIIFPLHSYYKRSSQQRIENSMQHNLYVALLIAAISKKALEKRCKFFF